MAAPFRLELSPSEVVAAAGGEPTLPVLTIENTGRTVEQFTVALTGLDPDWFSLPAAPVSLFPGERQAVPIRLHPPGQGGALAGRYPFSVVVRARGAGVEALASGQLDVGGTVAFAVELAPQRQRSRGRGHFRLVVRNTGTTDLQLALRGSDPEGACRVRFPEDEAPVVAARSERALPVEVLPRRRPWIGRPRTYDFAVVAAPQDERAAPLAVSGQLTHAPWLALGLPPALAAAIPLLLALGVVAAAALLLLAQRPVIERVWLEPSRPVADQPVTVRWQVRGATHFEIWPIADGLDPAAGGHTFGQGFGRDTSVKLIAWNDLPGPLGRTEEPLMIAVEPAPAPAVAATVPPTIPAPGAASPAGGSLATAVPPGTSPAAPPTRAPPPAPTAAPPATAAPATAVPPTPAAATAPTLAPTAAPAPATNAPLPATPTIAPPPAAPAAPAAATPCAVPVVGGFGAILGGNPELRARLGCAQSGEAAAPGVEEPFDRGTMLWRSGTPGLLVLYAEPPGDHGRWQELRATLPDNTPATPVPSPPAGRQLPANGFGQLWRERPEVRDGLGWATAPEHQFGGAWQDFRAGRMIWSGETGRAFWVLFGDGTYVRVPQGAGSP